MALEAEICFLLHTIRFHSTVTSGEHEKYGPPFPIFFGSGTAEAFSSKEETSACFSTFVTRIMLPAARPHTRRGAGHKEKILRRLGRQMIFLTGGGRPIAANGD